MSKEKVCQVETLCAIHNETKTRGLKYTDDLPYEDAKKCIDKCGDGCDCCFFAKWGGLGAR